MTLDDSDAESRSKFVFAKGNPAYVPFTDRDLLFFFFVLCAEFISATDGVQGELQVCFY